MNLGNLPGERAGSGGSPFEYLRKQLENNPADEDTFKSICSANGKLNNLNILTASYNIENYNLYKELDTHKLIDLAYRNYDITILSVNRSVFDHFTGIALQKADFNIIAAPANIDTIREFENYLQYMTIRHKISLERTRFVAWEYKKGVHLPVKILRNLYFRGCFIGCIDYSVDRERYKNLENTFYARWAFKKHDSQYVHVLSHFGVVPEISAAAAIRKYLRCGVISLKKSIRKAKFRLFNTK